MNKSTMNRFLGRVALTAALLFPVACAGSNGNTKDEMDAAGGMSMVNETCPVSGKAVDPEAPTRTYGGQTVGFCCGGCPGKWEGWSDSKKAEFVQQAAGSDS